MSWSITWTEIPEHPSDTSLCYWCWYRQTIDPVLPCELPGGPLPLHLTGKLLLSPSSPVSQSQLPLCLVKQPAAASCSLSPFYSVTSNIIQYLGTLVQMDTVLPWDSCPRHKSCCGGAEAMQQGSCWPIWDLFISPQCSSLAVPVWGGQVPGTPCIVHIHIYTKNLPLNR